MGKNDEMPNTRLIPAREGSFTATTDFGKLTECDFIIICVGTPLKANQDPDLSQVESAGHEVARSSFITP